MKRIHYFIFGLILISAVLALCSCARQKLDADNVYYDYFYNKEQSEYWIFDSNIAGAVPGEKWEIFDLVVASRHNGKPVTDVSLNSFSNCQVIRSVTFEEGIETIGASVFSDCDNLETAYIPKSVSHLNPWAFTGCNALKEVNVHPDNPYYCSVDGVVYNKNKTKLVFYPAGKADAEFNIPSGVLVVDDRAFAHCENLKRITVPETVAQLTDESIYMCNGLEGVTVDENNRVYRTVDGNLYSKDGKIFLRLYALNANKSFAVPEGVTQIGEGAFYSRKDLLYVVLPSTLTYIDEYAFGECENLQGITIPDKVTFIGCRAFWGCDSLISVVIPQSVTYIGEEAFRRCSSLVGIVFEISHGWQAIPRGGKFQTVAFVDFETPTEAAYYLKEKYSWREWKRSDQ